MVLLKLRKNDLVQFSSRALTDDFYFRVIYIGNNWYGMRVEEENLSALFPKWPTWAKDYESDIDEVDLHSIIGKRMSISSEVPEFAHNFFAILLNKYEKEKESRYRGFKIRKTSTVS